MITSTSLKHPTIQAKIKAARIESKKGSNVNVLNAKGKVVMIAVHHKRGVRFYLPSVKGCESVNITHLVNSVCPVCVQAKSGVWAALGQSVSKATQAVKEWAFPYAASATAIAALSV